VTIYPQHLEHKSLVRGDGVVLISLPPCEGEKLDKLFKVVNALGKINKIRQIGSS
jgi:hypothetical protein